MRHILLILALVIFLPACQEDVDQTLTPEYDIEVVGQGADCGDLLVARILTNQDQFYREVNISAFDRAYLINLDEKYKISGLLMKVTLQQATLPDTLVACTTFGPAYPQVKIITVLSVN